MGHPDRLALHDDDDTQERQNLLTDDPFLSLAASNHPSTSSVNTNFSRPRRHPSPETLKARLKLALSDNLNSSQQRHSQDTTPSESTDNTWATAASQQHINSNVKNIVSTDDDTITVNRLSHAQSPDDMYVDETPTQESPSEPRIKDYVSSRKLTSPTSPPAGSVSSGAMWDELDAIKRRLRQLELGRPSPGGGGDRPHTRGTTNSSSSPQRSSPFPSQTGTSITSASSPASYPLLNAAITKVKASGLSLDIAQAIEATAQEAISLALMTNHDPSSQPASPRAIRRKVDGVCRGLTEVCLAIADHQQLSQRQLTRAAQARAEDAQDSSPLSATGHQSMTLSRTTARRVSGTSTVSRNAANTTVSRARRPVHSVVGMPTEDFDDDGVSTISRPGLSRLSTIQYRPSSRAATEVFRDTTPPVSTVQRFSSTNRRSLLSRHGPSLSEYQVRPPTSSDHDSPREVEPPLPTRATTMTDRRRSLNLSSYMSSPPRTRTEYSRESGLPTPPARPVSLISPPRVNVGQNSPFNNNSDRRDGTIRRRPAASVIGAEKHYATDIDDDVRSTTLGRSASNRRSMVGTGDLRRNGSVTARYAREDQ